jgi:hypothetical protein
MYHRGEKMRKRKVTFIQARHFFSLSWSVSPTVSSVSGPSKICGVLTTFDNIIHNLYCKKKKNK